MQVKPNSFVSIVLLICLLGFMPVYLLAQTNKAIKLQFVIADVKTTDFIKSNKIETNFSTVKEADKYISQLPQLLISRGFPGASVDSVIKKDSSITAFIFLGPQCEIINLKFTGAKEWIYAAGMSNKNKTKTNVSFAQFLKLRERIITYYENHGYPFVTVSLDSTYWNQNNLNASLNVDKGFFYKIDSITVSGSLKIKNQFLQRYLNIPNGSGYNKSLISQVDKKLSELNFVSTIQPSSITMLGSGAMLNLYLKAKKTNQVNVLLGIMPASQNVQKTLITGDVNLDLKNMLNAGEAITFRWQQLQPKSPRLKLGFSEPYILHTSMGFDFLLDMFKKDSNFLQINSRIGCQFDWQSGKTGKIYFQWQQNNLLPGATDTTLIKATKKLPDNTDMIASGLGFNYFGNATNYKLNPRKGNEIECSGTVSLKKIKKNTEILSLSDPDFNYQTLYDAIKLNTYQIRCKILASHYFPLGKASTIKTSINSGLYYSPDIFKNDLFQIGGANILRGFDEESIYATKYVVFSAEYRLLFGNTSYLSFFTDYSNTLLDFQTIRQKNSYIGAGIGLQYETKSGLLKVSYAAGKIDKMPFNITQSSKIHFGYVNYF